MRQPNYALPPSQPLEGTVRSLRRSLGHPIHPTGVETLPSSITHILLIHTTPSLALVAAIVDPSLLLVDTKNNPYELPSVTLPRSNELLWAGRVPLSTRSFWCETGHALQGLRIATLGALRPRGTGTAAPSSEVIRNLVRRAGGVVTDKSPDVVFVAPGLSRQSAKVRKLLDEKVLCLGAGFIVDLLLRVHADPKEYVIFSEQKVLCGIVLDETVARKGRPLPVSKAVLERSKKTKPVTNEPNVTEIEARTSIWTSKTTNRKAEFQSESRKEATSDLVRNTELPPPRHGNVDSDLKKDVFVDSSIGKTGPLISVPCSISSKPGHKRKRKSFRTKNSGNKSSQFSASTHSCPNQMRLSSRVVPKSEGFNMQVPSHGDRASHETNSEGSDVLKDEITQQIGAKPEATVHNKRPRRIASTKAPRLDTNTSPPFAMRTDELISRPCDLISPTTPAALSSPKRPRLDNSKSLQSSQIVETSKRLRHAGSLPFDADINTRRQLCFPSDDSICDVSAGRANFEYDSRTHEESEISNGKERYSFSTEDGFRFLFIRLGQPSPSEIDRFLHEIRYGEASEDDNECDERNKGEQVQTHTPERALPQSQRVAESPPFGEAEDALLDVFNPSIDERNDVGGHGSLQQNSARFDSVRHSEVDAFRIPIPKRHKIVAKVIDPEMSLIERSNELNVMEGHGTDDHVCQNSITFLDWIVGAENLLGVSHNAICAQRKGSTVVRHRRLWSSLHESDALYSFAETSASDYILRSLTGVCVRLLSSGLGEDAKKILSETLLAVRDKQVRAGFDSLQEILSSHNHNELPLRHKALAAIWTALVQTTVRNGNFEEAWKVLNGALNPRIDEILDHRKFKENRTSFQHEKRLNDAMQTVLLSSYIFSIKLDFNFGEEADQLSNVKSGLHPENWTVICRCMDKLCGLASLKEYRSMAFAMSLSFLQTVAISIGRELWPVTDEVMVSVSKMLACLSSLDGKECFCTAPSMGVSQFETLAKSIDSRRGLSGTLKTICDCSFFLGWLYTVHGQGNPMKRALKVIRGASSFARSRHGLADVSSRGIYHHIGLVLAVADSLACSSRAGELLLCKMLTSKCPRPNLIASRLPSGVGEHHACWRATLQAVWQRCEVLLMRGLSVQVYVDWISQHLLEALAMLRKSTGLRSERFSEKEALRAQDSLFCTLCLLLISSLTRVNKAVVTCLQQENTPAELIARDNIGMSTAFASTCIKILEDLISQIRSNFEESISKNRHELLFALLSLIESQLMLITQIPSNSGSESRIFNADMPDEKGISCVSCRTLEDVIVNILGGGPSFGEESSFRGALKTAARVLAHLIELRNTRNDKGIQEYQQSYVSLIQRANMDVTFRFEVAIQNRTTMKQATSPTEDKNRLVFWSQAARSTWIPRFLQQRDRPQVMCISAALLFLGTMTDDYDTAEQTLATRLIRDCASLEPLRYIFEPVEVEVNGLDKSDHPLDRVEVVEKILRLLVKHWSVAHVCGILKLLDDRLKELMGSSLKVHPTTLILFSFVHAVSAQLEGFSQARFLHPPLALMAQAISRLTNSARDHSRTYQLVQIRVMSALSMTNSDMETRVLVLRVVNAFPTSDSLSGLWGAPLLPNDEVPDEWTRRAEKQTQEWREFLFTSVIEDPLFAGRNIVQVVRRLAAAAKGDIAMRRLVQDVLVRGRGKLDSVIRRDGRACREWSVLCEELLEA